VRLNHFSGFNNRKKFLEVIAEKICFQERFPGLHPQPVTLDGIDLAVMGKVPERLGQIPCRKGIGAES
jgi:hypothetical protein